MHKNKVQVVVFRLPNNNDHLGAQVLLLKLNEDRGGFWQHVTGGVEKNESITSAACRELKEETGITLKESEIINLDHKFEFDDRWGEHACEHCFLAYSETNSIKLDATEHTDFKWVNANEIKQESYGHKSSFEVFKLCLQKIEELGN